MEAEVGMLVVETIAKIRRAYFVHGQPIKTICREFGVSRKVVRKVIRSEARSFGTSERRSRFRRWARGVPRLTGCWRRTRARDRGGSPRGSARPTEHTSELIRLGFC